MSRVRNALKMAGTWPQDKDETLPQPQLVIAPKVSVEVDLETADDPEFAEVADAPLPQRSVMEMMIRRVRRFLGMRVGGPVPRCSSVTRRGLPCRAPAMANGFCRMHGGLNTRSRGQLETAARFTNVVLSRFAKS